MFGFGFGLGLVLRVWLRACSRISRVAVLLKCGSEVHWDWEKKSSRLWGEMVSSAETRSSESCIVLSIDGDIARGR